MKTTINLPDEPLKKLRSCYPEMTMTAVVGTAIRNEVLRKKWEDFKGLWGKVPIKGWNISKLRDRKHKRPLRYAA